MHEQNMQHLWMRIDAWLAAHAPQVLVTLQPGASEDAISDTEAYLGVVLPRHVKDSYRIHDGQLSESPRLMGYWELLSLEGMRFFWSAWKELLDAGDFAASR